MQNSEPQSEPQQPNLALAKSLFDARTILISGEITQELAAQVVAQLLALSNESDKPITLYVNSQGGHVESGDTIHDIIRFIKAPVRIVGTGWVASAGALIYVSVPKKRRFCLPNTRFLLHQPAGGAGGTAADIAIEAQEILLMRERLNKIFSEATGQTVEQIAEDTRRNFWLDAEKAKKYGIVGKVVSSISELDD